MKNRFIAWLELVMQSATRTESGSSVGRARVRIHESLEQLGGLEKIAVNPKEWMVSQATRSCI